MAEDELETINQTSNKEDNKKEALHLNDVPDFKYWQKFIENYLGPEYEVDGSEKLKNYDPRKYLTKVRKLLKKTPKRVLANYFMTSVAFHSLPFINHEGISNFRRKHPDLTRGFFFGYNIPNPDACQSIIMQQLPYVLATMYSQKLISNESMSRAMEIEQYIREAVTNIVNGVSDLLKFRRWNAFSFVSFYRRISSTTR